MNKEDRRKVMALLVRLLALRNLNRPMDAEEYTELDRISACLRKRSASETDKFNSMKEGFKNTDNGRSILTAAAQLQRAAEFTESKRDVHGAIAALLDMKGIK